MQHVQQHTVISPSRGPNAILWEPQGTPTRRWGNRPGPKKAPRIIKIRQNELKNERKESRDWPACEKSAVRARSENSPPRPNKYSNKNPQRTPHLYKFFLDELRHTRARKHSSDHLHQPWERIRRTTRVWAKPTWIISYLCIRIYQKTAQHVPKSSKSKHDL